ncbi:MAG TPA: KGK family protein [Cyanobacteria bacterium UBA11049]|nr:KGK family protein [Cyanobacteria bacterium UBA11049]
MNSKFTPLNCDDDVILLERDTFTVGRFKELSNHEIRNKLNYSINEGSNNRYSNSALVFSSCISLGEQKISFTEIQFNSIKDCQILKIGSKGWQKGKLKINVCISPQGCHLDKVCLEFCPDELVEPESPLDDIRKLVEQK